MRKAFYSIVLAVPMLAISSPRAEAYGAVHAGYTHVSPTGNVQHVGYTAAAGPRGVEEHSGYTAAGPGGAYHVGGTAAYGAPGAYGAAYHEPPRTYSPTMYGNYSATGTSGAAYRAGVVRYP